MLKRFFVVLALTLLTNTAFAQDSVRVTYYNLRGITASGIKTRPGIIAVSRDLLKKYPMHSTVKVEGYGVYKVEDKMAAHKKKSVDIWSATKIPNGTKVKITLIKTPK